MKWWRANARRANQCGNIRIALSFSFMKISGMLAAMTIMGAGLPLNTQVTLRFLQMGIKS